MQIRPRGREVKNSPAAEGVEPLRLFGHVTRRVTRFVARATSMAATLVPSSARGRFRSSSRALSTRSRTPSTHKVSDVDSNRRRAHPVCPLPASCAWRLALNRFTCRIARAMPLAPTDSWPHAYCAQSLGHAEGTVAARTRFKSMTCRDANLLARAPSRAPFARPPRAYMMRTATS